MTAPAPRTHWQGCPCVPDAEGLHCQTCGIRLPAASRKRSIDESRLSGQTSGGRTLSDAATDREIGPPDDPAL